MATVYAIKGGPQLVDKLCDALGIKAEQTHRIVLDVPCDGPVMAYVELYAQPSIIEIDWSALAEQVEIRGI